MFNHFLQDTDGKPSWVSSTSYPYYKSLVKLGEFEYSMMGNWNLIIHPQYIGTLSEHLRARKMLVFPNGFWTWFNGVDLFMMTWSFTVGPPQIRFLCKSKNHKIIQLENKYPHFLAWPFHSFVGIWDVPVSR